MNMNIPSAPKKHKKLAIHDHERIDDYYWMRLTDDQKTNDTPDLQTRSVVKYLNEENAYCKAKMAHTDDLQETIYKEIIGRIKQTDMSVPYIDNGYYYITRYTEGKEYAIHCRKFKNLQNEEEILIDENKLAEPYEFFSLGGLSISPNNKILIYGEDTVGRRQYTLKFKDLNTGKLFDDVIPNTTGSAVWGNDNKTIFYTTKDDALRPYKVMRHVIGTDLKEDETVLHEPDETFRAFVFKTKSKKYIVTGSWATLSQEFYFLEADQPLGKFDLFQKRIRGLEYSIDHFGDNWYIRTNKDGALNYKIMKTPINKTSLDNWKEVFPYDPAVFIEDTEIFKDYFVISERTNGNTRIRVLKWSGENGHIIDFGQEAYMAYTSVNRNFDTDILRLGFTSMITPNSIFDYNMDSKEFKLLKQQEVVGEFNSDDYQSEREIIKARDGEEIPVSIVYRKGFKKDGSQPLLLYAYGSYGHSIDPYFSSARLSLLDRGFAFAIAHVRGGQEMGRQWYDDGKLLKKKNTFFDFIDCGLELIKRKYAGENLLFAMGGSAGGLLMGAVMNMNPEMWKGIVAAVPFVDVITTMLDESIPLTTGEFDEWGNPKDKKYYDYILSYSPIDNVENKDYPALLVTSGYFDSQVQYWEPTKWVAKLREMKSDENLILLNTNMEAGHGGASGRFRRFKETALEYAFLLDLADKI